MDVFDRPASKACVQNASLRAVWRNCRGNRRDRRQLTGHSVGVDAAFGSGRSVIITCRREIVAAQRSLAEPPAQAPRDSGEAAGHLRHDLRPAAAGGLAEPERSRTLWGQLRAGAVPDWLEPVGNTAGEAFAVYRVKR